LAVAPDNDAPDTTASEAGRARVEPRNASAVSRLPRLLCAIASAVPIVSFLFVCIGRVRYPFDLEWVEGALVEEVRRLIAGKALYVAPSIDYVPLLYNPLYFLVAAALARVSGAEAFTLRLVSIASTCASLVCLFLIVWKERRNAVAALSAAGLYAATYSLSGGWFDLGRVDSLCVALCLAAIAVARWATTRRNVAVAALISALAFATKQNALVVVPGITAGLWMLRGVRTALEYVACATVLIIATVLFFDASSNGWYFFYAFSMPGQHPLSQELYVQFWVELLPRLPIALVFGALFLGTEGSARREVRGFYGATVAALVGAAYGSRIHSWSFMNDLMPAHAGLALLFGLGMTAERGRANVRGPKWAELAHVVAAAQLLFLWEDVRHWIPTAADRDEGQRLVARIRALPGDVRISEHAHLAVQAGKNSMAHEMAIIDVMRMDHDVRDAQATLHGSIERAYAERRFSAVITDDIFPVWNELTDYYRPAPGWFVYDRSAFIARTGWPMRPSKVFLPLDSIPRP
jgi:hypothetical protein